MLPAEEDRELAIADDALGHLLGLVHHVLHRHEVPEVAKVMYLDLAQVKAVLEHELFKMV